MGVTVRLLFLFATLAGPIDSYRALPVNLQECYGNDGSSVPVLPLNLQVLLDVIRKIERQTASSMSMRTLSAALIKSYKLDGIVYSSGTPAGEGVVRFAARGSQRARNRIVEELIPGDTTLLREVNLSHDERCLLHFALSNTIWEHYESSEEKFCGPGPVERFAGRSASGRPKCPREGGVVLTRFGTVAMGSVISAIAAALEPQTVRAGLLLRISVDDQGSTMDRSNRFLSGWYESVSISEAQIDNIWIATLAGELAEVVVYQGPIYDDRMFLGATGFWNSTMRPRVYYVLDKHDSYDLTRAELVGGVDGLVIGKQLGEWMKKFENLRLSQVLDMYYSEGGIAFDRQVKACLRGDQFPRFGPKSMLEEQTYAASQLLAYLNSVASMTDAALQRFVVRSVQFFSRYTEDHLFTELHCRTPRRKQSRIEFTIAFDGSWTREYTADFLAVLVDDMDVSIFGSKMGIIHGQTGNWILKTTDSPSTAHKAIHLLRDIEWPTTIELTRVYETVLDYLDQLWEDKRNNNTIGNFGQAVVLLVPQLKLTDQETKQALTSLKNLKSKHPETHFLYYTCESMADIFKPFLLSDEDRIVKSLEVDDISRLLSTVPMILRPTGCNKNIAGTRLQLEEYVNPSETITYRLHPQWRMNTKKVTLSLVGVGYGTLKICWWNQWTSSGKQMGTYCKNLSLYGDISLTDYNNCDKDNQCPNTYFKIMNVSTVTRCTENDCKTPDQVRYILRMESFQCSSSSGKIFMHSFSVTSFIIFLIFL